MAAGDILFVHQNFPGQFGPAARALKATGRRVAAVGAHTAPGLPDVPMATWKLNRGSTPGIFAPATRAEADSLRGRAALDAAMSLSAQGFSPSVVVFHAGWGEGLFLREAFPAAKHLIYGEFYYHAEGVDVGFDPEFGETALEERIRVRAKNMSGAMALLEADHIVTPTAYQVSLLPQALRPRISVIHEGIDTTAIRPGDGRVHVAVKRLSIPDTAPIITFINRNFEPMRGYHIFMRALPKVLEALPQAHVVLIGADARGYGADPGDQSWKARILNEVRDRLDLSRLHFTGRIPHADMVALLQASSAHVYLTYPFVLSWSLLEAMACGCAIVASDTPPVRDAIVDGENGLLTPFFDVDGLADRIIQLCGDRHEPLRDAARRTVVERFDQANVCLPAWLDLIAELESA